MCLTGCVRSRQAIVPCGSFAFSFPRDGRRQSKESRRYSGSCRPRRSCKSVRHGGNALSNNSSSLGLHHLQWSPHIYTQQRLLQHRRSSTRTSHLGHTRTLPSGSNMVHRNTATLITIINSSRRMPRLMPGISTASGSGWRAKPALLHGTRTHPPPSAPAGAAMRQDLLSTTLQPCTRRCHLALRVG